MDSLFILTIMLEASDGTFRLWLSVAFADNLSTVATSNQKALQGAVKELKREHPTLEDRLVRYRAKRSSYDAKRIGGGTPAGSDQSRPVRHAYRDFSG
ncbi:MAG TPA: hypothetical protein VII01_02530 [Solirubrobacteraceae bacterium]